MTNLTLAATTKTPIARNRSAERAALATAIAVAAEAQRVAERGRDAVARATELVDGAESKLTATSVAVADAREEQCRRVAAAVTAGHATPANALRAARAAETDARDDLDAAKAALEQLRTTLVDLEDDSRRAEIGVEAAVNTVLAAEAVRLVEQLEALKAEIPARQAALHFIRTRAGERRGNVLHEVPELARPFVEIASRISSAVEVGLNFHVVAAEQHHAFARWQAAASALATDADAALPI